uniref:Uncharacterized protein n=1 Tax=viral metagenome TaxID=1070528 RepID=A0A6C0K5H9_9ZZZZ
MSLLNPQELLRFLFQVPFSEFSALCGIINTPQSEFLYEQTLAIKLKTILEKKTLPEIQQFCSLNNIPIIDDKKELGYIIALCLYYAGPQFNLKIKGCIQVDTYYVRNNDSEQIILLIGERHNLDGNANKIIDKMYKNTTCPIDIINEQPFVSLSTSQQMSNASLMAGDSCVNNGVTPKDDHLDLDRNKQFVDQCIVPYQGRIKKFYEDYRSTKYFRVWSNRVSSGRLPIHQTDYIKILLKLKDAVIDFHTYLDDPQIYHTNVVDAIKRIYDRLKESITKQDIENAMKNGEKNHMHLMKGLIDNFDLPTLEEIKQVLDYGDTGGIGSKRYLTNLVSLVYYYDLPMLLRIVRLLKENKSRYIVCFMGDYHRENLQRLLSIPGLLNKIMTSSTVYQTESIPCEGGSCVLSLKKINCLQKTIRMQYYDSIRSAFE